MQAKEILGKSKNGIEVYFDPLSSHATTHFADAPQLKELVKEIVTTTILDADEMLFDTEMGRIVGNTDLVENEQGDEIVYAKRKNRDIYTSFNKTKLPQPCSTVALGLAKQQNGSYELLSAWVGSVDSPPFPGDEKETPESKPYWMSHSLAWGTQKIQPGTETTTCPW